MEVNGGSGRRLVRLLRTHRQRRTVEGITEEQREKENLGTGNEPYGKVGWGGDKSCGRF